MQQTHSPVDVALRWWMLVGGAIVASSLGVIILYAIAKAATQ